MPYPEWREPEEIRVHRSMMDAPETAEKAVKVELIKGPNVASLPKLEPLPETLEGPVLLKVGDDISTDEIMPAGARVLPFRSNIPKMSEFVFEGVDPGYVERALEYQKSGSLIVAGDNYGQGSSREHAALAPRFLGLRAVIAKSFARIHWQNLANFGILPLTFVDPQDYDAIEDGDQLKIEGIREILQQGGDDAITVRNNTKNTTFEARHRLSSRQRKMILAGSILATVDS